MKHLLSSSAYLVVNKRLARQIGLKAVVLLADLISKENYFIINGTIKNGWFYNTSKNIERDTTLTNYQQKKAIKKLETIIPVSELHRLSLRVDNFLSNLDE